MSKRKALMQKKTPNWLIASKDVTSEPYEVLLYLCAISGAGIWSVCSTQNLARDLGYLETDLLKFIEELTDLGLIFRLNYKEHTIWIINEQSYTTGNLNGKWRPEPDIILDVIKDFKADQEWQENSGFADILDIERQRHERSTKPLSQ